MTIEDTAYNKLSDPALLGKIDELFAHGVGQYVDLPQIVVVGDQSSGKSSVLEGLTKLPFPRNSGLCTRFATLITFRRAKTKRVSVSIRPHVDSDKAHVARVQAWKTEWEVLTAYSFSQIMKEVYEVMGLSGSEGNRKTFSNDVLQLEILGPDEDHLSVIDVPGIFKNTTEGVTTKNDIELVRDMVYNYMRNPRSIMLIVVPANVDIATQEIVEIARELDPGGERTLGVLTKPDLVDKGAESAVVDLINEKQLGNRVLWSIVRNPGQQDLLNQNTDRISELRFFYDISPWNTLEKDRVGIGALRTRLKEVITTRTRQEFPKVKAEISKRLQVCRQSIQALGPERDTPEKQRVFLATLAIRYERVTSHALSANYGVDDLFDKYNELRIATRVAQRNDIFSSDMSRYGHERDVDSSNPVVPRFFGTSKRTFQIRTTTNKSGLEGLLQSQEWLPSPGSDITRWLKDLYQRSRGFELGTFGSTLLPAIMKEQSKKWDLIALGYISDIIVMTHSYILCLLEAICIDERVKSGLVSVLMDDLLERYGKARDHVIFLLGIERAGPPATLNDHFGDNLDKRRQERLKAVPANNVYSFGQEHVINTTERARPPATLNGQFSNNLDKHPQRRQEPPQPAPAKNLFSFGPETTTNEAERSVPVRDGIQTDQTSNTDLIIRELHDILSSYYEVACRRFVDNVLLQAAHHLLVTGPDTPLRLFSTSYILNLSEDQLENIAGEDPLTARKRSSLRKEIEGLEKGRKILL